MLHCFFNDIPHEAAHDAGAIPECRQQIQIRVAIGAKLFVGQKINLVDGIAVFEFFDEYACHETTFEEVLI